MPLRADCTRVIGRAPAAALAVTAALVLAPTLACAAPAHTAAVHALTTPVAADAGAEPVPTPPAGMAAAPADATLKLWLYDPRAVPAAGLATGIFLHRLAPASAWRRIAAGADGSLYLALAPGDYEFDTVAPDGLAEVLPPRRYRVSVPQDGPARVLGQAPDSRGIHAVTLDQAIVAADARARARQDRLRALASEPASTFKPASSCQLRDRTWAARSFATDVGPGFPKVRVRLPSSGRIRALIVPVDFADLPGRDDPLAFFTPLAQDMHDFYLSQSYGRADFGFDILTHWVRLPFGPERFGIDGANGVGGFDNYRNAIIKLTDGQIDYGAYDAVYFLAPKEMPMARMGSGPAFTTPTWTRSGYVVNGATGGADMYFNDEAHGIAGGQWKWMAHETGHAFGLVDEDLAHRTPTLGAWSIMADSWSNRAIEHNGWDRYLQGWLPASQVACLSRPGLARAGARVRLSPIERQDGAVKIALLPLNEATILVLESRRNEGYDRIPPGHEGVLAYTVDMRLGSLGGGYRTLRRPGSTDAHFEDAALHPGDTIAVDGVRVRLDAADADGDTVTLKTADVDRAIVTPKMAIVDRDMVTLKAANADGDKMTPGGRR